MALDFFTFTEFFPSIDTNEAKEVVSIARAAEDTQDIFLLAGTRVADFADQIAATPEPLVVEFHKSLTQKASEVVALIQPQDPSKLTPEEEFVILGGLNLFYSAWPDAKLGALHWIVQQTTDPEKPDAYTTLTTISELTTGDIMTMVKPEFFDALARYYLVMAGRYVTIALHQYKLTGRVLDDTTDKPKSGVHVNVTDKSLAKPRAYGSTFTNDQGYFRLNLPLIKEDVTLYYLDLEFTHPQILGSVTNSIEFDLNKPEAIFDFELTFGPVASKSKTIVSTGTAVPADVQAYLTSIGEVVNRLEDIRRLGGFRNLPSDTINKDSADLKKLDGLASLEIINPDISKNSSLYARGYTSVSRVANTPAKSFVQENRDVLGDYEAAQVHYQAQAAHLYALNSLAGELTVQPNKEAGGGSVIGPATGCGCADCASAVSPLAYLADLLSFTLDNLNSAPDLSITTGFLVTNFFQDIVALPANCSSLNPGLCQNRIAAEVMRKYYASIQSTILPALMDVFDDSEEKYLMQTYELLLNKLGTNYAELRRMRAIPIEEIKKRKPLSDRLGITLNDGADTLEQLFIDLSDPTNIVEGIEDETGTSKSLEQLFGLRSTNRHTTGAGSVMPESKLSLWKKARVRETWLEQSALQNPYWGHEQVIIDPDMVTVDDIRTPVAGNVVFDLWEQRRKWLDDEWVAMSSATRDENVADVVSNGDYIILHGHTELVTGSNPKVHYLSTLPGLINQQFDVLDQFIANGNTYFKVPKNSFEQNWYGGNITINTDPPYVTNTRAVPSVGSLLERVRSNSFVPYSGVTFNWPELTIAQVIANLRTALPGAKRGDAVDIATISEKDLTIPSAERLLELYDKNEEPSADSLANNKKNLTEAEWDEARNIVLSILKSRASQNPSGVWREEEADATIELGPDEFWASMREPRDGELPSSDHLAPLLDPELTTTVDVPEVTTALSNILIAPSTTSLDLLAARRTQLTNLRESFVTAHDTGSGFQDLFDLAFGDNGLIWDAEVEPNNDYLQLLNSINDPDLGPLAQLRITEQLSITPDELRTIVTTGLKESLGETIIASDWDRTYSILVSAHKRIFLYPDWLAEEIPGTPLPVWKIRKAQLPKWRATATQRKEWIAALAENSAPPIIDADLLGPYDLANFVATDRAVVLWQQRWVEMHGPWNDALEDGNTGWLHDVNTNSLSSASALDTLTQQHLEHIESGLNVIEVQQENAIDIRPRLAQLNLTMGEFNQLMAVRDILSASQSLTDEEKLSVKRILAQVKKRRKAFVYRKEEMITGTAYPYGITLSQDFFQIPSDPIGQFPPAPEHPLVPWLTSDGDLIRFRSTLRGRIEQEKSALDALKTMLDEVDEAMMVKLRDALVTVCGDPTRSLVVNARTLGDKLLIDLENNCCFKTNRVAAAIETLQQFLWKTRTGDILHDYPTMEYIGGDFDEAWMWMGSYSNWRAAMFVFLYPENVLLPSLRKNQTPAFQAVVEATRNNRRFGPKDACKVARDYRDYLVDLVDLDLKCSAEAEVFLRTTGCGTQTTDKPQTLFVFAQGRATHNSYFTTVDARDKANINQNSYWQAIPGLDDTVRIFGCTVYFIPDGGGEFIYLFFTRTGPDNADKFFALRFNLLNGLWEENPLEFKVDTDDLIIDWQNPESQYSGFVKDDFSPIIKAIAVRYCTDTKTQPTVAISLEKIAGASKDVYTFYWPMRQNGTEFKPRWGGDGWRLYIEGNKILKGLVRFFVGIWVDENAKMLDHSLLVLRSGTTTYLDLTAWGLRHDWLLTAKAWFLAVGWPEWGWEWNGEIEYIGAEQIDGMITAWEALLPQVTNHVGQSSTDYLAYIQTFGGTTGGDTIYIPPQYNADLEREIRTVLPFYDWSTVHLEVVQNGDRRRDVVTYTTDDPEVPIITNDEPLNSSDLSQWLSFIAPVRDARYFDPTNAAFEAGGGLLLHQGDSTWGGIGVTWEGKEYHIEEPLESRILVSTNVTVLTPTFLSVPTIQSDISLVAQIMRPMLSSYDLTLNSGPNFRLEEYVWEAYYFVPMQIALQLCTNGYYQDALDWFSTIYDISRPVGERKIYYGLVLDEQGTVTAARAADWYSDPLNPHAIAALRPYTYTRYTMLAIAQCLLAYADAEYTTDNSETVPRAREMYEDAQALLEMLAPPDPCPFETAARTLGDMVPGPFQITFATEIRALEPLSTQVGFSGLVSDIADVLGSIAPMEERLASIRSLIATAQGEVEVRTMDTVLDEGRNLVDDYAAAALGGIAAETTANTLSEVVGGTFGRAVATVTGLPETELGAADLPWLMDLAAPLAVSRAGEVDRVYLGHSGVLMDYYNNNPAAGLVINSPFPNIRLGGLPFTFCVVPNPIVKALLMTAEVQLWKIHNCMNIAGMVRELDPFSAPTDSTTGIPSIGAGGTLSVPTSSGILPSAYRYRVIVDRAKQLVSMAQQVESAFLATLEKLDDENYSVLRAEQDLESSKASVKLQDLKVTEADDGVTLANLQKERASIQVSGLQGMIDEGLLASETLMINNFIALGALQALSAIANALTANFKGLQDAAGAGGGLTAGVSIAAALAANIGTSVQRMIAAGIDVSIVGLNTANSIASINASLERRKQEWEFQKSLANQDVQIGEQGIKLAKDRMQISGQERVIAELQSDHAKATLDFLKNKFSSVEMYEWMSGVLQDVYEYFLQEATAMAQLAHRQLSFERQLNLPPFIRADYWVVDGGSMGGIDLTGGGAVDRKGITGSSRLLKDLYEMDQYAFNTNSPKLQMSKTISINEIAPEALADLRNKGIASFRTTQNMFDRDYPGQYLRLIKKVSVTVIALNSPVRGIRATLKNGGVSRVITGGITFQEKVVQRYAEQIALSGGVSDYGVFQLQAQGDFLDPFEGSGVDTQWEFRMQKAANPFDYGSIADVLLTIEYEAMYNYNYEQSVAQQLNNEPPSANLAFSFKNNLPDQWFDLNNPEQTDTPFAVRFLLSARDQVPNMSDTMIQQVAIFFVMNDGTFFQEVVRLGHDTDPNAENISASEAVPNENLISTRMNAQGFMSLQGTPGPAGAWLFGLADTSNTRSMFASGKVDDIVLIITYDGDSVKYLA